MTSSFCLCLCAFLCLCYCICLYFCSVEHHRRCNSPWAHSFTETYYSLLTQLAIILHISTKGLEVEEGRHFPILGFWLPLLLQTSLYREVSASSSVCWLERNWEKLPSLNFSPPPPPPNLIAHSHLFSSLTWQFIASIVSHNIFMFCWKHENHRMDHFFSILKLLSSLWMAQFSERKKNVSLSFPWKRLNWIRWICIIHLATSDFFFKIKRISC